MELVSSKIERLSLIHYSNAAPLIVQEGFRNCVRDPSKLGLTRWCGPRMRYDEGFVFAFVEGSLSAGNAVGKYGNGAVLFTAPGIRVWHHADQELQVITHSTCVTNLRHQTLDETSNPLRNVA